ncbi:MAG: molybdopterin cofactor-binding domain-containing protein [Bauldia sp.]
MAPPDDPATVGAEPPAEPARAMGLAEVRGGVRFVGDMPIPPDTLFVAPGLSSVAAGRLVRVDLHPVKKAAGVVAVLTASDIPGENDASVGGTGDQPVIAAGDARFFGEVLFAVVARSTAEARLAAMAARVTTAPAIAVTDLEHALAGEARLLDTRVLESGSAADAIQRSDRRVLGQMKIEGHAVFALEPVAILAVPDAQGGVTVTVAAEDPGAVRRVVARVLAIAEAMVTVVVPRLGGGFGGRRSAPLHWAALAAVAAHRTGRAALLRLDRDDEMSSIGRRHDFKITYRVGFDGEGLITAVDATFAARCGNAPDRSGFVLDRVLLHADNTYHYPAFRLAAEAVATNTPAAVATRGVGAEGVLFAERMMDNVAVSLSVDPLEIRKKNLYAQAPRDRAPSGHVIDAGLLEGMLAEIERTSNYARRRRAIAEFNRTSPILKRGLALVPLRYGVGSPLDGPGAAFVALETDGSVRFGLSLAEGGQGAGDKAAALVARAFGIEEARIVRETSDGTTLGAAGATGVDQALLAVLDACRNLKDALFDFIEEILATDRERVEFADGIVRLSDREMPLRELVALAAAAAVPLAAFGTGRMPRLDWTPERGAAARAFHYQVFAAATAEVTVDVMTGELRVDRVDILMDAGRPLDPLIDRGLVEGGFAAGLGWLTMEEFVAEAAGRPLAVGASTYLIPTAAEMPADLRVAFYQSSGNAEDTAYRSKDVSDASMLTAISVFCAISDAVGSLKPGTMPRLHAPATPEAIMRAVRAFSDGEA